MAKQIEEIKNDLVLQNSPTTQFSNEELENIKILHDDLFKFCSVLIAEFTSFFESNRQFYDFQLKPYAEVVQYENNSQFECRESRVCVRNLFDLFMKSFSTNSDYQFTKIKVQQLLLKLNLVEEELLIGTSIIKYSEDLFFQNFIFKVLNGFNFHRNLDNDKLKKLIIQFIYFIHTGTLNIHHITYLGGVVVNESFEINSSIRIAKFNQVEINEFGNEESSKSFSSNNFDCLQKVSRPFMIVSDLVNIKNLFYKNLEINSTYNNFFEIQNKGLQYLKFINVACKSKIYPITGEFLPIDFCSETYNGSSQSLYPLPQFNTNLPIELTKILQDHSNYLISQFDKILSPPLWLYMSLERYSNPRSGVGLLNQVDILLDYVSCIEGLLSDGGTEITFKISLLVGNIIGKNREERIVWQKKCSKVYAARSFFSHGCTMDAKRFEKEYKNNLTLYIDDAKVILDTIFELLMSDEYISLINTNRTNLIDKLKENYFI
jgi:hypothetical protein